MKMRLKVLVPLGLVLLAATWLFWPRADRPAPTAKSPAPPAAVVASVAPAAGTSVAPGSNAVAITRSEASTNRVAFRLTNTTRTLDEMTASPRAILLENALVDTAEKLELNLPKHLRAAAEPGAYIVQAPGPVTAAFRAALQAAGAEIVSYIPNNAYLVQLSGAGAGLLSANPQVQAVLPYEPYFKVQSSLLGRAIQQKPLVSGTVLTLGLFSANAEATIRQIQKLGGNVIGSERSPFGPVVRVLPLSADWLALAQLSGVMRVEPATHRQLANDLSRVTMAISTGYYATNENWLNLYGSNVLVSVNDTGIDANQLDLVGRVFGFSANSLVDSNGHGTHIAGIIAGSGLSSPGITASGSVTNADYRGKAPLAKLYSFGIFGSETNVTITEALIQAIPALTNALISNNSWSYGVNEYDLSAASYDAAVRDSLPGTTGPQPVLYVFPAGNAGGGRSDGFGGSADSIDSPGTAKNVLTVGALEQLRNITNEVVLLDGSTNNVWEGETDSADKVAFYSARGNVGVQTEGTFGRFKPDVVAPGSFVLSTLSTVMDLAAYYNPTNVSSGASRLNQTVFPGGLVYGGARVPVNAVGVTVRVQPNVISPTPFPTNFPIYFSISGPPGPTNNNFATSNNVLSIPPGGGSITDMSLLLGAGFEVAVGNPTNFAVNFNLIIQVITTNDNGNTLTVLSNLNQSVDPYMYRSGTSMAAAAASGSLALLQEFLQSGRNPSLPTNPSPALLKAMLINGSRLTPGYDNFALTNNINHEGWGLVNVPNSLPAGLTNAVVGATPMFALNQSPTNVLATGDSHTYTVAVPAELENQLMRLTLVWTDPPGNPAAAIKLVNNLDLVVTNLDTGEVYFGNQFRSGGTPFTPAAGSNTLADAINNVENIWLSEPLSTNYSVTVIGRHVAVNAVTLNQTNIVQDYALVISCGESSNTNGVTVAPAASSAPTAYLPQTTYISSYTNGIYFNQLAGASAPLLSTNKVAFGSGSAYATNAALFIGQTNQWHFFVVTNTTTYTNAAFIMFFANTLATPRMGTLEFLEENATRPEADLNLFVASDPDANAGQLTNLNYSVISNCVFNLNGDQSSLARGGTKFIVYSNSVRDRVYYIGVQSQDQMAAQFGFLSVFSEQPFSTLNDDGSQTVNGLLVPVAVPDGNNAKAGVGYCVALAIYPMEVGDVTVTNTISHENYGDLVEILSHGSDFSVLNNKNGENDGVVNLTTIYNDNGQSGTVGSSGPGSLNSFDTKEGSGPWILTVVDDAETASGFIENFTLNIKPNEDLEDGQVVDVPPNSWWFGYVDVPVGYTNLTVSATNITIPPGSAVQMYLNYDVRPDFTNYLVRADLTNPGALGPGNSISYGPPLEPGRYFVGLYNPNNVSQKVYIIARLAFNAAAITEANWEPGGVMPLLDDAVTNAYLFITDTDRIQDISVGLRVDHERISDLVFHLITPDGTRYLLMENRGGQSTNGAGATVIVTNIVNVSANGNAAPNTNVIPVGMISGTFPITYDFYTAPDQMTVYYGNSTDPANLIFDTGMTNNPGTIPNTVPRTIYVSFPPPGVPASSTDLTIVINQFATNLTRTTAWRYTAGGVITNHYYLAFTEDTNLTTTPIKYAVPPFVPAVTNYSLIQTNLALIPTNVVVLAGPVFNTNNNHFYYLLSSNDWTTSEAWAVALGGHLTTIDDAVEDNWVFSTFGSYGGTNRNLWIGLWDTNNDMTTVAADHATNFVWVSGSPATYRNWWLPGQPDNGGGGTNNYEYFGFIDYSSVGKWQDGQDLTQLPGKSEPQFGVVEFEATAVTNNYMAADSLYYHPEVSLESLIGTSPLGEWTLEILDNRAGATNNASLVSWSLNFTYANTNYTTGINTNLGGTNYIPGGALQWFLINVPTNADISTNSLLFASLPLHLWWSTNEPPTITNLTDVQLLNNSTGGSALLFTNGSPFNTTPAFITSGGTYYLGIQNTNVGGANYALEVTFHLNLSASGPTVVTKPATNIVIGASDLQGEVTPNSTNTTVYFDYGQTTNYGFASVSIDLTNNYTLPQWVIIGITNLTQPGIWHYRAVGYNIHGTNYGADLTFTNPYAVPPPYAFTMPATRVNGSSAQLNGMATPNGYAATAWFEWGTSPAYVSNTPPVNVGTNFNVVYVTNNIIDLVTNQAFHYRLVVSNEVGVTYGFDQVFAQGSVIAWGAAFAGQTTPVPSGLTNLVAGVGAGFNFSLALNFDGTVVAWGDNAAGQTNVPVGMNNAVAVAGGYGHSLALRSDRTVSVWGANGNGQTNVPPDLTNAVAAASGAYHCLALRDDGNPVAWGLDTSGQTNLPSGLSNVVAVAAGFSHCLALKNDGTVVAWGNNAQGQTNVPASLTNIVAIAAGHNDSLALKQDGTVVAWGSGFIQTNVPASLTNVTAIAAGDYHCQALKGDGSVWFWGDSSSGQLNNYPANLTNVFTIAGGGFHTVSVQAPYGLNVTNTAPYWTNVLNGTTVTMNEMTTLSITNAALDSNSPPQLVFYSLVNKPSFVDIDSFTGVITANPSETNGPSTNLIITLAYDNGFPTLSTTSSFTLIVNEVNRSPFWPTNVPASTNYTIGTGQMLTVANTASDPDAPTNGLSYTSLVSPTNSSPAISLNGVISWTPVSAGVFTLMTVVTDSNPWALTNQNLTATNYLTVTVTNVPVPVVNIASIIATTNNLGSNGFLLTWFAPSNYLFQVQWTDSLAPQNWQVFTNPSSVSYNTNAPGIPPNAQFNFFDDGSQAPFTGMRFYRLLLLSTVPVFNLVDGIPLTNAIPGGATTYYKVNVPANADFATNALLFAQDRLNLWFSTNPPPVLTSLLLGGVTNGVSILSLTSTPTNIVPGATYYLGVQNTNLASVSYALGVNFHLVSTNPPPVFTNAITIASIIYTTNSAGSNGFLLTWYAPSNYLFQVQWTDGLASTNWQAFTNPSPVSYNTNTFTSPTNTKFNFFDDGSQAPFAGMRFYRLQLVTNAPNVAPVFTLGAAATRFVTPTTTLTVTNDATDANVGQTWTYALVTAPSGVNLDTNTGVITWTNVPTALAGSTNNTITTVVTDNGTPALSATNVLTVWVNPIPSLTSVTYGTNGTTLQWSGWTNEQFNVRWATNLVAPIAWNPFPDTITSTNGTFLFLDTNAPLWMKFYQLVLLP